MGGMDRGVAFVPAVPGLAPGVFMGEGQDARSERAARWHGQPRPTHEVAHENP
jgi:hypothetical protein